MQTQALTVGRKAFSSLATLIWPPQCLICATGVEAQGSVCPACWPELPLLSGLCCDQCALPLPGHAESGARHLCDLCAALTRPWGKARAPFLYAGQAQSLTLQFKLADRADLAPALARYMWRAAGDLVPEGPFLIAPVPLHFLRLIRRRYNQSALLAQQIARQSGWPLCPDLLKRRKHTPSQNGLNKLERAANLQGAFTINPRQAIALKGQKVLLIDDVLTTGATLTEASHVLRLAGAADVCVLVLARAPPPGGAVSGPATRS